MSAERYTNFGICFVFVNFMWSISIASREEDFQFEKADLISEAKLGENCAKSLSNMQTRYDQLIRTEIDQFNDSIEVFTECTADYDAAWMALSAAEDGEAECREEMDDCERSLTRIHRQWAGMEDCR